MNDILHLKGRFEQKSRNQSFSGPKLPRNSIVTFKKMSNLIEDLKEMKSFWSDQNIFSGALVSAYYNKIAAKSNRIKGFFSYKTLNVNNTIVGAKFSEDKKTHIITHYISLESINNSITEGSKVCDILQHEFNLEIDADTLNSKDILQSIDFSEYGISKSKFISYIVDAYYLEKFDVEINNFNYKKSSIVTLYDTGNDIQKLLGKLDIKIYNERIINESTVLLDDNYLEILMEKAPFLVAMATENLTAFSPSDFLDQVENHQYQVPEPMNEPTIGVIDTLFDKQVYFAKWVDFYNLVDKNIQITKKDYVHGTAVSSLIVDGPILNPTLDDGCGRFKVRHFGVATKNGFNSFTIIKAIKKIIAENKDIRVWNLSLGSNEEVNQNFISAEGAILDQLQFENDVIFVIAGTNKNIDEMEKKIGAPADSINSVIVNSVGTDKKPAAYSRKGIILSFFTKPDVSYYGGTPGNYMNVCEPLGKALVAGTSYAAPWISRKLSYLIDKMGLNKEVAKAILIDSAIGWDSNNNFESLSVIGHGIVPIRIEEVVKSASDEIKFVVSGISEKYDTFNYNFPVPIYKDKYPYVAKATLCYFPKCSRNQGVDYTNTELDIYFGRIDDKGKIKSVNKNKQSIDDETHYLYEENARTNFRKWDNIKNIKEQFSARSRGKKVYDNQLWGMSIKTKERLNNNDGEGIRFGVVVTLKEINGVNRIEDFIQQCSLKGWLVNRINVENRIDIYQTASEKIELK